MSVCVYATVRLCAAAVCLCAAVCSAPGLRTFPAEAYCYVCPLIMKETWTSRRWKQFALALLCDVSCCCVSSSQATSRNSRNVSLLLLRRPCLGCVPMGVACVAASVLVACFLQESAPTCYKNFLCIWTNSMAAFTFLHCREQLSKHNARRKRRVALDSQAKAKVGKTYRLLEGRGTTSRMCE